MRKHVIIPFLLAVCTMSSADAHALLRHAAPGAGATVSPGPTSLRLSYSEGVEIAFSKVVVAMADGMAMTPKSVALDPSDPATIIVAFAAPLPPGHYTVTWHVVSVDTHKTQGDYDFDVKP